MANVAPDPEHAARVNAASQVSELPTRFERVIAAMGSERRRAFEQLRAAMRDDRWSPFQSRLADLDNLDLESTTFESRFRALQTDVLAELAGDGNR